MINRLTYYLLVFVAVLAAACSHIDEMESPVPDQNLVMRFDMGCDTKVSNDDITSQEFIVYDYIYGASSEGYSDGTCYIDGSKVTLKYRDGSWGFYPQNSDTRVDFLWTKTGEHRFYAFNKVEYPFYGYYFQNSFEYNAGNPFIKMGMASLNLTNSDHKKDVVYSSHLRSIDGSANQYSPITLEFKHLFATLSFDIKNTSDETKEITKFSITDFNITSSAAAQMSFTGNLSVTFSGKGGYQSSLPSEPIQPGDSWDAFDGVPVFVWPQGLTPYTEPYVRFTVNGVDYNLRLCEEFSASQWESGKHYHYTIVLSTATPTITLQPPTTTITHTRSIDGVLTGSEVQVVLNNEEGQPLSDSDCARIKNIQIQVKKGGTVYKTYSSSKITSNTIIFSGDPAQGDNKYYLPRGGGYSVEVTYDGLTEPILGTATSPDPEFNLYLDFIAGANVVTMYSASVNISENVLGEVNLSSSDQWYSSMVMFAGQTIARFITGDCVLDSPQFLKDASKSGMPYVNGYYTFSNSILFDGIAPKNTHYPLFNKIETWTTPHRVHPINLNHIQYAEDHMQDGDMYVIRATQDPQRYWYVDSDGNLNLSSSAPNHSNITKEYIFRYDYADQYQYVGQQDGYNQYSPVGTWYSCYIGKYMNTGKYPVFDQSDPALYIKCATGWGDDMRDGPVDMMKGFKELLRYKNPVVDAYWGGTESPDQYWKWDLYEVVVE